ncbi:MAG: gliding motility-associated ABC transporter permease subunit GldF [Sphingobacteriaceae bacterium]|nr:gliding motility-associated ABC transporter permease subunit GldF [Sphingobacteriaceae bacterium]
MYILYLKEIRSFLSSLIGYMAIGVFISLIGVFMWIIPSESGGSNILDNGFANIDPLFYIAPWVYLFLIPAITMRSFSEERKSGTLELLLTRPLSDLQIVLAKYFAGLTLVLISLLPTLIYYYSVNALCQKNTGMDTGGMWGSYVGLFFLGAGFVAIGTFASAISENQVIAFIFALLLCFVCYIGFDFIADSGVFGKYAALIKNLGINEHYTSMSRGVIDTRDAIYFISVAALFNLLTRLVLESRKW